MPMLTVTVAARDGRALYLVCRCRRSLRRRWLVRSSHQEWGSLDYPAQSFRVAVGFAQPGRKDNGELFAAAAEGGAVFADSGKPGGDHPQHLVSYIMPKASCNRLK